MENQPILHQITEHTEGAKSPILAMFLFLLLFKKNVSKLHLFYTGITLCSKAGILQPGLKHCFRNQGVLVQQL